MKTPRLFGRSLAASLSARVLVLTVAFVMLAEVLIYVPSIARFRFGYLEQRIEEAHLAALSLLSIPNFAASKAFERELLAAVGARGVALRRPETSILIFAEDMPPNVDGSYDLRTESALASVAEAFATLLGGGDRVIRVVGHVKMRDSTVIELVMADAPMHGAMVAYTWNILGLSLVISLITAGLLFLALQSLLIRPIRRITASMIAFRREPENPASIVATSRRADEVGIAQHELAEMENRLLAALKQKTRLAELGTAVSKVNHDLRNILTTAQLVSDRLVRSDDPEVRRVTPRLIDAIDRAINLCQRTLKHGSADEPPPQWRDFTLAELVEEVADAIGLPGDGRITWRSEVNNGLVVAADRDQLFRVLLNLGRNAVQSIPAVGEIRVAATSTDGGVAIEVADTGTGLPNAAREHLFEAFIGAARAGGAGLGLAIARDLMRAHGGGIELVESGPSGTRFRLFLPQPAP